MVVKYKDCTFSSLHDEELHKGPFQSGAKSTEWLQGNDFLKSSTAKPAKIKVEEP